MTTVVMKSKRADDGDGDGDGDGDQDLALVGSGALKVKEKATIFGDTFEIKAKLSTSIRCIKVGFALQL